MSWQNDSGGWGGNNDSGKWGGNNDNGEGYNRGGGDYDSPAADVGGWGDAVSRIPREVPDQEQDNGGDGWGDNNQDQRGEGADNGWGNDDTVDDGGNKGGDGGWGSDNGVDDDDDKAQPDQYDLDNIEIAPIDWDKEEFQDAQGYEYVEHEDIQELSEEDVQCWRNSWHMTVKSSDEIIPIPKPIRSFAESKFPEDILSLIDSSMGGAFDNPTPIQSQGWPMIMTGKDVIGVAQTGSGKTLAFILPGVMHIRYNSHQKDNCPIVMVQAPTRELARQIADETKSFAKGVKVGHTFGGESVRTQQYSLRSANLIAGTPGRTQHHLSTGTINLRYCTYVVLDEADRMLDMGFQPQIEKIFRCIRPTGRQLMMFTATWPYSVHELASKLFKQN